MLLKGLRNAWKFKKETIFCWYESDDEIIYSLKTFDVTFVSTVSNCLCIYGNFLFDLLKKKTLEKNPNP